MSLSQSLANDVALRFNEVWHMRDTGVERQIYTRAFGVWKPMKSRMFQTRQSGQFVWQYNADNLQGDGIADWFTAWQQNGGVKLELPTLPTPTPTVPTKK